MTRKNVSLEDKYISKSGIVFVSGMQALVRLPIAQRRRDHLNGLKTAGYITGYRGSPLGGYDTALWRAEKHLASNNIKFQPAVNEDLAATACWGTQQLNLSGSSEYDGVFSIWYGKGPGVDRSGDPLKHGNLAGSSPSGGVLALAGDDHGAKSSTTAHQSEQALVAAMIPILNPASVQELLDFGLFGIALSRYAGTWVGLKCVNEIVESSATILVDDEKVLFRTPKTHRIPDSGVHIRWPDSFLEQEERLVSVKLESVKAFVRENNLDRVTHFSTEKRLGIVSTGKAWLDVCQALQELGLNDSKRNTYGISVYKVAMPWPLEPDGICEWASGFEEILVVEEKRNLIEDQLARILFGLSDKQQQPRLSGKKSTGNEDLLPSFGELSAKIVRQAILAILPEDISTAIKNESYSKPFVDTDLEAQLIGPEERTPWFCAGCPHNTSTLVPDGSRALSGIGCHFMANWMDRNTGAFTQMGGEGASWIGLAPFTKDKHIFQNIGDGTYFHSGLLAIRAAVASGVNITYKILFNDAVALTGGQHFDGDLTPWTISWQLSAEGVKRIVTVTDDPTKYPSDVKWAPGVKIYHRRDLDKLQRELRDVSGVTAIIYDQVCAAELRRRRKRGIEPNPSNHLVINADVCEGCGDCNLHSNCVAVHPLKTELGTKRVIDQTSCNKDFSCLDGFCPSFVTIEGGSLAKSNPLIGSEKDPAAELLVPDMYALDGSYNIVLAGIGGTGVVTAGALLGMAAHIEGKGCSVLDQTGLSQKNGAVLGHVQLFPTPQPLAAIRIGSEAAHLVVGFDMVVAASRGAVDTMRPNHTRIAIDSKFIPLATMIQFPDKAVDAKTYTDVLQEKVGSDFLFCVDAAYRANEIFGKATSANIFMLGYVYQKGWLPLMLSSLQQAIRLNGVDVEENLQALSWGRVAAADSNNSQPVSSTVEDQGKEFQYSSYVTSRCEDLKVYQNSSYADVYQSWVERARAAELRVDKKNTKFSEAVSRYLFKLMAYKDEYEVARMLSSKAFMLQLRKQFTGNFRIHFNLAPPIFSSKDPDTKLPRKIVFNSWFRHILFILSKFKFLRGTVFDPFRWHKDRREERGLLREYKVLLNDLCDSIDKVNFDIAVELASLPTKIRGFGHIKRKSINSFNHEKEELLEKFQKREVESD